MKKLIALALVLVLALTFTACGSKMSAMDKIKQNGKIVVMTSTGFPPFEYLGADGKPAGVDIEIAQMIADELGVKLEVIDMDFNLLVESLKAGKGDLIAAGMTATEERKTQIDFTTSYAAAGQMVLLPMNSSIKSVDDLQGKTVAVQESTTGHIYVQEELGITPLAFKNAVECASSVASGKADAAVLDNIAALSLIKAQADKLTSLPELATAEELSIGVAKGNEDLLKFVNDVLAKAEKDGKIEEWMISHNEISAQG